MTTQLNTDPTRHVTLPFKQLTNPDTLALSSTEALWIANHRYDEARRAADESMAEVEESRRKLEALGISM